MSLNPFGTRKEWQDTKKKYGIPDGVAKFGLGPKLESFDKTWQKLESGDYQSRHDMLVAMLKLMDTYEKALLLLADTKFKGKTASEQKSNAGKAKADIASKIKNGNTFLTLASEALKSVLYIQREFPNIDRKHGQIDPDDKSAVSSFYTEEMRNLLGQPVKIASKLKLDRGVLDALKDYDRLMNEVNDWAQSRNNFTPRDAWKTMRDALEAIRPVAEA